ncbi:MAG: hypothetical protein ABIF09_05600 [Gemmatimonadota bacterium]
MEFIAEAAPTLAQAIMDEAEAGANWMVMLRAHMLEQVLSFNAEKEERVEPVTLGCDACGKKWPVPADQVDSVESCPFCGHGKDETAPDPSAS